MQRNTVLNPGSFLGSTEFNALGVKPELMLPSLTREATRWRASPSLRALEKIREDETRGQFSPLHSPPPHHRCFPLLTRSLKASSTTGLKRSPRPWLRRAGPTGGDFRGARGLPGRTALLHLPPAPKLGGVWCSVPATGSNVNLAGSVDPATRLPANPSLARPAPPPRLPRSPKSARPAAPGRRTSHLPLRCRLGSLAPATPSPLPSPSLTRLELGREPRPLLPRRLPGGASTDAQDEDEAGDHEHRVPVKLERGPVPAEPLSVVEDPDEGEDHRQEADEQRRHQQRQEAPVALHGHQRPILRAVAAKELGEAAAPGYWPAAGRGVDF